MLGKFSYFYHENVCCLYSLESPGGGDSNEYNQYIFSLCEIEKI